MPLKPLELGFSPSQHAINPKDYDMLVKTKEQYQAEADSQSRSQQVKKKRHGSVRVLIPVRKLVKSGSGVEYQERGRLRGGVKSRRLFNKNVWVDPEMLGSDGIPKPRRRSSPR